MQMTGDEVRKFRKEHGLSLHGLAWILGVSKDSVSRFEKYNTIGLKVSKALEKLTMDEELLAENIVLVKKYKQIKNKKTIGYIPDGKSFDEHNAKLLNFSREADKLGLSYGNYIAMRRDNCDGKNISKSIN